MTHSYLNDLLEQPVTLQATLESLNLLSPFSTFSRKLRAGRYRRVILTGMGSSYYGLYPLLLRLFALPVGVIWLETAELIHNAQVLIDPSNLIIAVSQSGQSAEVVRLTELAGRKVDLIGITNTPSSPLAENASLAILTLAGEEASVSCKTYISALAAHAWLGDHLLNESTHFPPLEEVPHKISEYWSTWQDIVEELRQKLQGVENLYLLGRGVSLAAACTGALIIKEAARYNAEGMNAAAFRHGPLEVITSQTLVLVFLGVGNNITLNERMAEDVRVAGGQVEVVGISHGSLPFCLPECQVPGLPLLEIMPAQMVSLALAELIGHEAGQFAHAQKITTVE
jgi:glucosamine--fructose-6-phosphate aminotransferase (isomerizing)